MQRLLSDNYAEAFFLQIYRSINDDFYRAVDFIAHCYFCSLFRINAYINANAINYNNNEKTIA